MVIWGSHTIAIGPGSRDTRGRKRRLSRKQIRMAGPQMLAVSLIPHWKEEPDQTVTLFGFPRRFLMKLEQNSPGSHPKHLPFSWHKFKCTFTSAKWLRQTLASASCSVDDSNYLPHIRCKRKCLERLRWILPAHQIRVTIGPRFMEARKSKINKSLLDQSHSWWSMFPVSEIVCYKLQWQ